MIGDNFVRIGGAGEVGGLQTVPYRISIQPDSIRLTKGIGNKALGELFGLVDRGDGGYGWIAGSHPDGGPSAPDGLKEPGTPPDMDVRLSHLTERIFNLVA